MQRQVEVTVNLKFFIEENLTVSEIDSEVTAALGNVLGSINSDIISPETDDVVIAAIYEVAAIQLNRLDHKKVDSRKSGFLERPITADFQQPNGFDNWHETHFEICYYLFGTDDVQGSMANQTQALSGRGGLYDLSKRLTNEFETMFTGRVWDSDFFDEIDKFLEERNKGFVLTF